MLYTLDFNPGDVRYERIYAACSHLSRKQPADRREQKLNNALLDKLLQIGTLIPALDAQTGAEREHKRDELRFYETKGGGQIVLEQAERDLALEHMTSAIPQVHRQAGASHAEAHDWLEKLVGEEPKPKEAQAAS